MLTVGKLRKVAELVLLILALRHNHMFFGYLLVTEVVAKWSLLVIAKHGGKEPQRSHKPL